MSDSYQSAAYVWGSDSSGQLGLGSRPERSYSYPVLCRWPVHIAEIACGESHSLIRTVEGLVYAMGDNGDGRLGVGDRNLKVASSPVQLRDLETMRSVGIACGNAHSAAISDTGQAYMWGLGCSGALGAGNTLSYWRPHLLALSRETPVAAISCGGHHTALVLREASGSGQLYLCGAGEAGQLGFGQRETQLAPRPLPFSESIQEAACGSVHTLFRTSTDRVFAMGGNSFGQLGIGSKRNSPDPTHLPTLDGTGVRKLVCWTQSAAITHNGSLYVWGTGDHLTPYQVKTTNAVKDLCIGNNFSVMLDVQGTVWSWGTNSGGELGQGDYEARLDLTPVIALQTKTIRAVACGRTHVIALTEDLPTPLPDPVPLPQPSTRLLTLYQDELDARKSLELELLSVHHSKSTSLQQAETLRAENLQLREELRRLRSELMQREADVTCQVQSNIQLAARNKTLAERVKVLGKAELRVEELEVDMESEGRLRKELEERLQNAENQCEDWEYQCRKCEQDKAEAKSVISRLEEDLKATRKSLSESKRQAETASKDSEAAIVHLNQRQKDLEIQWTLRLDEAEMQLEEQLGVIKEQSRKINTSAGTINALEEEIRQLKGKMEEKSRALQGCEARVRELELQLAQQERKNKGLVEALEREVRERATALRRAKDSLSSE